MSDCYNTITAARYLTLSVRTLAYLRVTGEGPVFAKVGRRVIYRPCDLDTWLAARSVKSTSEGSGDLASVQIARTRSGARSNGGAAQLGSAS